MTQRTTRTRSASRFLVAGALAIAMLAGTPFASAQQKEERRGDFPVPSPYPKAWELKFEHGTPQRIVVDIGNDKPKAYWYLTYTVTNNTNDEHTFLPVLELLAKDGRVFRSDSKVPPQVFGTIKDRERNGFLESQYNIGGALRLGPDQARDGVAIWEEVSPEMGTFSIFVGGLSGEYTFLKDASGTDVKTPDGNPVILRKTLQLNYLIRGDEVYPGEDAVNENAENWVMR
ncbi:MAG TPA: hypothetical protein VGN72_08345 [Tepidisphaeraceae bacterium]|jgi:hypothetical protein|nr:hypothetical protein [Tepidisphaeraceae bacterium]